MSETPATPAVAGQAPAAPVKLTAIQLIERQLNDYKQQLEQAAKRAEQAVAQDAC